MTTDAAQHSETFSIYIYTARLLHWRPGTTSQQNVRQECENQTKLLHRIHYDNKLYTHTINYKLRRNIVTVVLGSWGPRTPIRGRNRFFSKQLYNSKFIHWQNRTPDKKLWFYVRRNTKQSTSNDRLIFVFCHYTAGRLTSIQQPKGWPSNTSLRLRNRRRRFCEFTAPCATNYNRYVN